MSDKKISALTDGTPALTTDIIPIDRAGANFSLPASSVAALADNLNASKITAGVLASARGGVAQVGTAAQGYFCGGYVSIPTVNSSAAVGTANTMYVMQFVLPYQARIRRVTIRVGGTTSNGAKFNAGIYDVTGNTKLLDALVTLTASINTNLTTTVDSQSNPLDVTLPAGTYWFAWACDSTTPLFAAYGSGGFPGTSLLSAGTNVRLGTANAPTSSVLASSVGTITGSAVNVTAVLFEP